MVFIFCGKCGNKINVNATFCSKCGNRLNNNQPQFVYLNNNHQNNQQIINNSNQNQFFKSNSNNSKLYLLGGAIGIGIIVILLFLIGVVSSYKVYFNQGSYTNRENDTISSSSGKNGTYKTIIVHDRTYEGVTISTENDANNLISNDSTKQKSSCPKDIIAIENEIIKNYNTKAVNLCEMDKGFALEIKNVIKTIHDDFPTARGHLTNMSLANVSMSEGYIAAFMPIFPFASTTNEDSFAIKTQILLNTSYFLNIPRMEASVKDGGASGHFPPNTNRYSPVAHEFGHYLSFVAMMKSYNLSSPLIMNLNNEDIFYKLAYDFNDGDFSLKIITEAYNNYKLRTNTTMSILDFRSSISQYAIAKDNGGNYIYDETIAEAFHDHYLNGNYAKDASKEIVEVLKKYLGGN